MRVFISYAWEGDNYRELVKRLAARLREDGIDARLDAWHLEGLTIPEFMNREVRLADKILIVCSPQYRRKVHAMEDGERITGSGWEAMLVTSTLWASVRQREHINAILFRGTWAEAAPDFLIGLPYLDLSDTARFEANYRELLRNLTDQREQAPPLGKPPDLQPKPVRPLRGLASEPELGSDSYDLKPTAEAPTVEPLHDGSADVSAAEPSPLVVTQLSVLPHEDGVLWAEFSPDGGRIVTASKDQTARVWDAQGRDITTLSGHTSVVLYATFSPTGTRLVTASQDGTALVWAIQP